jgi:hypothetical protein
MLKPAIAKDYNFVPMLFSTEMVRAIISDNKTVTRRAVKKSNSDCTSSFAELDFNDAVRDNIFNDKDQYLKVLRPIDDTRHRVFCKYYIGDIIWVRETFYSYGHWTTITENGKSKRNFQDLTRDSNYLYQYFTDWAPQKEFKNGQLGWFKRPALFMPKEACRLFLQITSVRIERLQEITNEQALKEGIKVLEKDEAYFDYLEECGSYATPRGSFTSLWCKINGQASWDANPYVWVIGFKRINRPEGFNFK